MLGRVAGLEDPVAMVARFLPLACDGFLLGPRVAERTTALFAHRAAPARLLAIDSYWRGVPATRHVLITSVARAAALGVDGVKVLMPWDTPAGERAACAELVATVIGEAEQFDLPRSWSSRSAWPPPARRTRSPSRAMAAGWPPSWARTSSR